MNDLDNKFSVYTDFTNYIDENSEMIQFLEENESLLNTFVTPIIKSVIALKKFVESEDRELNDEEIHIVEFGFNYLFGKLEQIKLYFKQLDHDYFEFEHKSYIINMILELEEYRDEIEENHELNQEEKQNDLNQIKVILTYFESVLTARDLKPSNVLNEHIQKYYDLKEKYKDIVVVAHAYEEYCAEFGI